MRKIEFCEPKTRHYEKKKRFQVDSSNSISSVSFDVGSQRNHEDFI